MTIKDHGQMNWYRKVSQNESPIVITDHERKVFDIITMVAQSLPNDPHPRVAGGWVRDKLMDQNSDDIDISLEGMTGQDFVESIKLYAQQNQITRGLIGGSYVVPQNLDKSKHLETAAIEIDGQKIDFVNMRKEPPGIYESGSRIPTEMIMGTPQEDAERRDLTINSMFYNIENGQVEDFTEKGMQDLQTMTLRTPLDPKTTFTDDPLRMLRLARFYARYPQSTIDPAAEAAMADPEVQASYGSVDPQRAGPEIIKTMSADNPEKGMRLLFSTGLYREVFKSPETENLKPIEMDQQTPYHKWDVMRHTLLVIEEANKRAKELGLPDNERSLVNLAAVFHDLGKLAPDIQKPHETEPERMTYKGHENRSMEISDAVTKAMGYISEEDRKLVNTLVAFHMYAHHADITKEQEGTDELKVKGGAFGRMRDKMKKMVGENDALADKAWSFIWQILGPADELATGREDAPEGIDKKRRQYEAMQTYRAEMTEKARQPFIDGREIMKMYPDLKPHYLPEGQTMGFVGMVKSNLLDAQRNNMVTNEEEARQFVLNLRPEIMAIYAPQSG